MVNCGVWRTTFFSTIYYYSCFRDKLFVIKNPHSRYCYLGFNSKYLWTEPSLCNSWTLSVDSKNMYPTFLFYVYQRTQYKINSSLKIVFNLFKSKLFDINRYNSRTPTSRDKCLFSFFIYFFLFRRVDWIQLWQYTLPPKIYNVFIFYNCFTKGVSNFLES